MNKTNRVLKDRRRGEDRRRFEDPGYFGIERRIRQGRRRGREQRRHARYKARGMFFANLCSTVNKNTAQLIDISRGGLSLRMLVSSSLPSDFCQLDLYNHQNTIRIDNIPYRMVSDAELPGGIADTSVILRRYGLAFQNLTSDQTDQLDYFLANHTCGRA